MNQDELSHALSALPGWTGSPSAIERTVACESFMGAIGLVNRVAEAAEEANHHPDMEIRWREVTFRLSTHSEGGVVTEQDLALARVINSLAP
ncbi:putative pterin-4-alpha-carbinolamine dehydratase [Virgisporangium aliadipatigenens]|uniref:Putative pterin-4-alpha-carbinolamine dehydratase n=1 Tax=Virgisporangium aliadipatigenens TaxID=741659 RepID=A0A8J3YT35_9ACTN|nr:4a-hydroxytetrahydrobiopterin dehydratase [Virgisporangium aliadipatigenens]GIJ50102.1 putative pterin-4-alpha-carbinolamine dehydratase [Virgisporangium aliadipatigenens]